MSAFDNLNRVGRCTSCDEPIRDIKTLYAQGHPYAGEAREVGEALDKLRIVTLILMDGHQCDITMCESCASKELDLPALWRKVVRTNIFQSTDEYRRLNLSPLLTPEQKEIQTKHLELMIFNVPVGALTTRKAGNSDG